jgi:uncharacterized protein
MNTASPNSYEPSVEEILTSIRRIVAEDHSPAGERATVPPITGATRGIDPREVRSGLTTPLRSAERSWEGESRGRIPVPAPIVSSSTEAAVTGALRRVAPQIEPPLHSLEDTVRDMLRPMLKAWLDENLPALVERVLQAEIGRLARGVR